MGEGETVAQRPLRGLILGKVSGQQSAGQPNPAETAAALPLGSFAARVGAHEHKTAWSVCEGPLSPQLHKSVIRQAK